MSAERPRMCFVAHTAGRVPDNVHFLLDDAAEEDWLYPLESFDFIHTRAMLGSFEDFRDIINRSLKYTKPGGWMESQVRSALSIFSFPEARACRCGKRCKVEEV